MDENALPLAFCMGKAQTSPEKQLVETKQILARIQRETMAVHVRRTTLDKSTQNQNSQAPETSNLEKSIP